MLTVPPKQGLLADQLNSLKNECLDLIGAKLSEAHKREMAQLELLSSYSPCRSNVSKTHE